MAMVSSIAALSLLLVCCGWGGAYAAEEVAFAALDPAAINQVVIMYKAGDAPSDAALAAVEGAEATVRATGGKGEGMSFKKCNAVIEENAKGMLERGLATFPMIFVSVEGQGQDRSVRGTGREKVEGEGRGVQRRGRRGDAHKKIGFT